MSRGGHDDEDFAASPWVREALLPLALFVIVVAVVCALVLTGTVQGETTYGASDRAPTTQPTVLIEP